MAWVVADMLSKIWWMLTNYLGYIFSLLVWLSVFLENTARLDFFVYLEITMYVDSFVNQDFDALTHIVCGRLVALGTVVH